MLGSSGGISSYADDDGSADSLVSSALAAFAAGQASEQSALAALAGGRLLVPVVPVVTGEPGHHDPAAVDAEVCQPESGEEPPRLPGPGEKASDTATPRLIGLDGRRAVPAFTSVTAMRLWQAAARPVPVPARDVCHVAAEESAAVVVDVAGPVPLAIEGARLAAIARGEEVPAPHEDPDVRDAVAAVLAGFLDVAEFRLGPGGADADLGIWLSFAPESAGDDAARVAASVGEAIMAQLGTRLRRGVAVWMAPAPSA